MALYVQGFQRNKIKNRNRYKSKKDQNSSAFSDCSNKEVAIDDSLSDEDDSSVHNAPQKPVSQKGRSLEEKLDKFFSEFANFLKNLEDKDTDTVGSRTSFNRDSLYVARQPLANDKPQPPHSASTLPGCLERRSATITRAEAEQQSGSGQKSYESGLFCRVSRKRSYS